MARVTATAAGAVVVMATAPAALTGAALGYAAGNYPYYDGYGYGSSYDYGSQYDPGYTYAYGHPYGYGYSGLYSYSPANYYGGGCTCQ